MPKPPTKVGVEGQAQPKPVPHNPWITRLGMATLAVATDKPISQQSTTKELTPAAVPVTHRIDTTSIAILQPIVEALNKILDGEDLPECIINGVFKYIRESEKTDKSSRDRLEIQEEVSSLRKGIRADLSKFQDNLTVQLNGITSTVNITLESSEKALKVSKEIKGNTEDIISKIGKVTNIADKITDTTQSYHDVLAARQMPTHKAIADPKILGDMDCRAKQILIDTYSDEGNATLEKSLTELIAKANKVLDGMSDASKPEKVKVKAVLKTKKNAVLLTLNSKEAVNWIREIGNEMTFADAFSKGVHIREREYILVAPRIPLTFKPENQTYLREIEEANSLPSHIIRKARWIKPTGHRQEGQIHVHALLSITLVNIANKLIKDSLGICSSLIRPMKQKREPIQCMKCRRWGHFADKCPESEDTCSTCGDKHHTSVCTNSSKRYCVSCGINSHASWDRSCPEFIRHCAVLDASNPANSMPFFPAEEDWTLATASRPSRIPLKEHFPAAYAVNSLPTLGSRKAQRRKGPNPNKIPLPDKNRYGTKEPGELANDGEGIPEWLRKPIESGSKSGNTHGDVTQQPEGWI